MHQSLVESLKAGLPPHCLLNVPAVGTYCVPEDIHGLLEGHGLNQGFHGHCMGPRTGPLDESYPPLA
jgi:hypothetical protein